MSSNDFHQPFAQSLPTKWFQYEDVTEIGKGSIVRDHPGKANLQISLVETKIERMLDEAFHRLQGDTRSPIGGGQEAIDCCKVQSIFVRTDKIFAASPF